MRTTVTLDPDIGQLPRDAGPGVAERPFTLRPQAMGLRAGIDPGRLNQLADELGSDAFADLSRRSVRRATPT